MNGSLILSIVAVIGSLATVVFVALKFSQSISTAFRIVENGRTRDHEERERLLDRLMTHSWQDYTAVRSMSEEDEGGSFRPEDFDEPVEVVEPGRWGHLSALKDRFEADENEKRLIEEDFGAAR